MAKILKLLHFCLVWSSLFFFLKRFFEIPNISSGKVLNGVLIIILFSACENQPTYNDNLIKEDYQNLQKDIEKLKEIEDSVKRIRFLEKLEKDIDQLKNDSLKNEANFLLSYKLLSDNDSINFFKINYRNLILSQKLNDSAKIAEAYWDRAHYHSKNQNIELAFENFTKAQKIYETNNFHFQSARMLLAIAIIQKNIKDYTGSEVNTVRAIRTFEELGKIKQLYSGYNNLGIVYNELQEYDNSLFYHLKAKDFIKQLDRDHFLEETTLNNIGVVYQNKGEHKLAITNFEEALNNLFLSKKDPELYAMLIDNLAYSIFQTNQNQNVEEKFKKALSIRDSINHKGGLIISNLHLSEFYISKNDSNKALKFAIVAHDLSKNIQNNRDHLKSLLLISNLDRKGGEDALNKYILISDSLQKEERIIRNKFTRIQFETDEFIAQNEQLNFQKKWIIAGFTSVILLFISLSAIILLKKKNKELKLIQLQQKSNEDIYNLMIESQTNIERGQEKEKKRISKELHDGILSQFFGVRLNLELLNDKIDLDSTVKREKYIKELKGLETEIRKVSHQLNSDLVSSDVSFKNILQDLLQVQENLGGYNGQINFNGNIEWEKISPKVKINLFRIIQEALHNINKYAEAANVRIVFENVSEELLVTIEDDGKGFEVEDTQNGIGMSNMKSRIYDLDGDINIVSNHTGTRISLKIPLNFEINESKNTSR